jgi:hypothetical protein
MFLRKGIKETGKRRKQVPFPNITGELSLGSKITSIDRHQKHSCIFVLQQQ